jgi:hypothetical protein
MLQGPLYPASVANDASFGTTAWTNPGNAQVSDGVYATVNTGSAGTNSQYLEASNFGFAVPANATITGILVEIIRVSGAVGVKDARVRLLIGGTVQSAADRASLVAWASAPTTQAYGGSTDLWGQAAITPAQVNAANFGVALSVNGNDTASVDALRITVYYALPKDLVTLARAQPLIAGYVSNTTNDALLGLLITSVSDAIEKYCRRRFVSTAYDELYNGTGDRRLLLRQYPIQKVDSVRYRPVTVLKVINNSTSQATQQARVQVSSTGLVLVEVASGVKTTTSAGLTWAACPTLQALATAITAVGRGWSAQVVGDTAGDYGAWPSADLYIPGAYGDPLEGSGVLQSQGALTALRQNAELKMHTYELAGYQWDPRGWLLRAIPYTDPELLHPEDLIWPIGINNFRVQYTAGYSTVPEAVQEACVEWCATLFPLAQRDPSLVHQVPPSGTASGWGGLGTGRAQPPQYVRVLLAPYRRYSVGTNQG